MDVADLHRFAPVIVALERKGVTPAEFNKLGIEERKKMVEAIIPEAGDRVREHFMQIQKRIINLKRGENEEAVYAEMRGVRDYLSYLDKAAAITYEKYFIDIQVHRNQRLMDEAQAMAGNLNK